MTIWNMEITASESPQTVHIPIEGKYYAIKNTGDHDILVSSYVTNPTEGADDVMKIPSGSAAVIPVKDGDLYVSAEEDGTYSVSIQDDKMLPWSGGTGSGGGSGGDTTHYKGTTTTPLENGSTTNPITIDGESYTAVFGDVVVYGYTEFVFDGAQWSEFGRPFDTTPASGSTNAVTSDGIYAVTPFARGVTEKSAVLAGTNCSATTSGSVAIGSSTMAYGGYQAFACGNSTRASNSNTFAAGYQSQASGFASSSFGSATYTNQTAQMAVGIRNNPLADDLFEVGNGTEATGRSNIFEVSRSHANVNGDIQINGVNIPTPYTTMPTITADMLGQIAMYVGTTGGGFTQGCFYVASTDGAAEPTYSWVKIGGGGDYTTTERKIGKWIDGSDLYQRTFEVTGLHNDGTYDDNILGTSNIVIRDWTGYLQYDTGAGKQHFTVQGYGSGSGDWIGCWTTTGGNDLSIRAKLNAGIYALDKAVITIKYTKVSVQANIQQTEEPTDESR